MDYLHRSLMIVEMIYGRESIQTADVMQKFGYMIFCCFSLLVSLVKLCLQTRYLYWNWQRDSTKGSYIPFIWHLSRSVMFLIPLRFGEIVGVAPKGARDALQGDGIHPPHHEEDEG